MTLLHIKCGTYLTNNVQNQNTIGLMLYLQLDYCYYTHCGTSVYS